MDAQVALLRVLDRGEYRTLGGQGALRSTFKLVGATNRGPEALKHDLRKRMSTQVWLPTLAQRRDDIPLLVGELLRRVRERAAELTKPLETPQADGSTAIVPPVWFVERLMRQDSFEGNVRDLEGEVNALLADPTRRAPAGETVGSGPAGRAHDAEDDEGEEARGADLTLEEVAWCITKSSGNVAEAARLARVSRPAFYRAMKRLGVGRKGEG